MPQRLIGIEGIASVRFADGEPAGSLGRLADAGFELVRPDGAVVVVLFAAISDVENRVVKLSCDESTLQTMLA